MTGIGLFDRFIRPLVRTGTKTGSAHRFGTKPTMNQRVCYQTDPIYINQLVWYQTGPVWSG